MRIAVFFLVIGLAFHNSFSIHLTYIDTKNEVKAWIPRGPQTLSRTSGCPKENTPGIRWWYI